jgi:hypothetical protein
MDGLAWQTAAVLVALLAAHSAVILYAVKAIIGHSEQRLCEKIEAIKTDRRKDAELIHKVKDDLAALRAELPLQYVRREDAIRQETVFHAKLDAIYGELKELREKIGS